MNQKCIAISRKMTSFTMSLFAISLKKGADLCPTQRLGWHLIEQFAIQDTETAGMTEAPL